RQTIQRSGWHPVATQPRVLTVALDQAALLEHPANAFGDVLHQCLKFGRARHSHVTEHWWSSAIGEIHASDKDHMEMHVEVQHGTKALDQRDSAGVAVLRVRAALASR